jgi:hypothetical protein
MHAYGEAIDINPVENPYLEGGRVRPPAGARFLHRTTYRRGMAVSGGVLVEASRQRAGGRGGRWTGTPDDQHFSTIGT